MFKDSSAGGGTQKISCRSSSPSISASSSSERALFLPFLDVPAFALGFDFLLTLSDLLGVALKTAISSSSFSILSSFISSTAERHRVSISVFCFFFGEAVIGTSLSWRRDGGIRNVDTVKHSLAASRMFRSEGFWTSTNLDVIPGITLPYNRRDCSPLFYSHDHTCQTVC